MATVQGFSNILRETNIYGKYPFKDKVYFPCPRAGHLYEEEPIMIKNGEAGLMTGYSHCFTENNKHNLKIICLDLLDTLK